MENKTKHYKELYVIIGILFIVIVGLVGFITYKQFSKEKNSAAIDNSEQKEINDSIAILDDKDVDKLISSLFYPVTYSYDCNALELYANNKRVVANDISNQIAYELAKSTFIDSDGKYRESISLTEMKAAVAKILGEDYKFDPASVNYNNSDSCLSLYVYDTASQTYRINNQSQDGCGGTCGYSTSYKLVENKVKDNILTVRVKVIFADLDTSSYYSDYQKTNKIGDYSSYDSTYVEKGTDYIFTFKLEEGNYVYTSSEPVNN